MTAAGGLCAARRSRCGRLREAQGARRPRGIRVWRALAVAVAAEAGRWRGVVWPTTMRMAFSEVRASFRAGHATPSSSST